MEGGSGFGFEGGFGRWRCRNEGRRGELTTRKYKHRIRQLHNREVPQIPHVHRMARYTDSGEEDREAIDEGEEGLDGDYGVDEAGEQFAREHGVLFD